MKGRPDMSDNELEDRSLKHRIDGLKVFIKVEYCFPLSKEEQAIYDSYDSIEKKMIYEFIKEAVDKDYMDEIINEIVVEEEKKQIKSEANKVK